MDPACRTADAVRLLTIAIVFGCLWTNVDAATYYVRPDGDNSHPGLADTSADAWATPDRGQPTALLENIAEGQSEIAVRRAVQLPAKGQVRIGTATVSYAARSHYVLKGCRGASAARASTLVSSVDWSAPGPGDTIVVAPGVYYASSDWPSGGEEWKKDKAAVVIASGGKPDQRLEIRGRDRPVIDGRDLSIGLDIAASYVTIDGFEVRRGGIRVARADGSAVRNCRVHEGGRGIFVDSSQDVEIAGNQVYDLHGAWTTEAIVLGRCREARVHHNTVVACGRPAIRAFGEGTPGHRIEANLLAWCRVGIKADQGVKLTADHVRGNCVWKMGEVQWLLKPEEGKKYYEGLDFIPDDLHADPCITSWDSRSPSFLAVTKDSPCAKGNEPIGAGRTADYPESKRLPGENLVVNPGFESGMYGWLGRTWQPSRPEWASWQIVAAEGASDRHCIQLNFAPPSDNNVGLRFESLYVNVDRGRPLTLSFLARCEVAAKTGGNLAAGVVLPSWHGGSCLTGDAKVTSQWQRHEVTLRLPPYCPNDVAVVLMPRSHGKYWVDDVKLEQAASASPFGPALELALDEPELGQLLLPAGTLVLKLINRGQPPSGKAVRSPSTRVARPSARQSPTKATVAYHWRWPFGQSSGEERVQVTAVVGDRNRVLVKAPEGLWGAALLEYRVEVADAVVSRGVYRVMIGRPAADCPQRAFFGTSPTWHGSFSAAAWLAQCRALANLGLGTLHEYLGEKSLRAAVDDPLVESVVNQACKAGLQWLWTPSGNEVFGGQGAPAPEPGRTDAEPTAPKSGTAGSKVTAEQLKAWEQLVSAAVKRYRDRVKYWEVLNEPNTYLTGDEYLRALEATSKILRRDVPQVVIIGGSVVNAPRKDLYNKTIFDGHQWFDQFSYHPYRFGLANPESENESFRRNLLEAKEDLTKAGSKAAVYLTEEGMGCGFEETRAIGRYVSHDPPLRLPAWGEGEIRQAQFLARMYLTALAEGCQGYSYHTLYGLINDAHMTPKLALCAIHTMNRIAAAKSLGRLATGPDYVGYQFQMEGGPTVAAVWAKDAEYARPKAVVVSTSAPVRVVNLFGNVVDVQGAQGQIAAGQNDPTQQFLLGREMAYIVFPNLPAEQARQVIEQAFQPLRSEPE